MNGVKGMSKRRVGGTRPAGSYSPVKVAEGLPRPGMRVEIDCVAVLPDRQGEQ